MYREVVLQQENMLYGDMLIVEPRKQAYYRNWGGGGDFCQQKGKVLVGSEHLWLECQPPPSFYLLSGCIDIGCV